MTFKEALSGLLDVSETTRTVFPKASALPAAISKLSEKLENAGQIAVSNFDDFAADIHARAAGRGPASFSGRELRTIGRHLFTPTELGTFASNRELVDLVVDRAASRPSPPLMRALTQAYFFGYGSAGHELQMLADVLVACPDHVTPDLLRFARSNGLMTGVARPTNLARLIMASSEAPNEQLQQFRFVGGLERSSFVEEAFGAACEMVSEGEPNETLLHRLLDWAVPVGHERAAEDRGQDVLVQAFPAKVGGLARGLLAPWRSSASKPSAELEARIRNLFLAALGDPRFKKNIGWNRVDDLDRQVFIQWMNAASVRQFFDIVTETMSTDDERRMWRYRRKFWTAYLDDVQDAWVVFGPEGARLARRRAVETGDESFRKFARFSTSGAQSSHAALLLKIGDLVVAEWSHSGKCRMWVSSGRAIPELYESEYAVHALREGEWETSHHGNEHYSWQFKVASKIRAHTGVSKRQISYRVD